MNHTMSQIADATAKAKNIIDTDPTAHFPYSSFGNGKYQVSILGGPTSGYSVAVYYRGTCVVQFTDNTVRLYARNYHTTTTKNVINAALAHTQYSVYQQDFSWYVHEQGQPWSTHTDLPFHDDMILSLENTLVAQSA